MILFEASLSFLGLGVQPPTPSWGKYDPRRGGAHPRRLVGVVFPWLGDPAHGDGINLVGDGLR